VLAFPLCLGRQRRKEGNCLTKETTSYALTRTRRALIRDFKTLYIGEHPKWAWFPVPSIPFVGTRYRQRRDLLIYASAENLSWMNSKDIPERYRSELAWDRYRAAYEERVKESDGFFPNVGIAPVEDGGLLAAGLFVAGRRGLPVRSRPRAFMETLAVSNWCKFSIRDSQKAVNRDYVRDVKKLTVSLPYAIAELAELKPAVILIPNGVWRHPILSAAMRGAVPNAYFIPVPQCNPQVVNTHLREYDAAASTLRRKLRGTPLAEWMRELDGFNEQNAWRYIAMLASQVARSG
jgi:hypothetical protein